MKKIRLYVAISLIVLLILTITMVIIIIVNKDKPKLSNINKIAEIHCLEDLCIKNLKIIEENEYTKLLSGEFINKNSKEIEAGFVNINFKLEEKTITFGLYYPDLKSNQVSPIEYHFTNNGLNKAENYDLTKPSNEELQEYYSAFVD